MTRIQKTKTGFTLTRKDGTKIENLRPDEIFILLHFKEYIEKLTNFVERMMAIQDRAIFFGDEIKGTLKKEMDPVYTKAIEKMKGIEDGI